MVAKRLVVFASGSGSNFEALVRQVPREVAEVALLVCDQPGAYCLERAAALGVPTFVAERAAYPSKAEFEWAIASRLAEARPDLIALAGYMRIIGPGLLGAYPGQIVNIHPSLLPAFPGRTAIADALAFGVKVTGVTVHFVDAGIDTGPIIAQAAIRIDDGEALPDLTARIHKLEHQLYPEVVTQLLGVPRRVSNADKF